ncbi:DUF2213 domain-containing protein [Acetobacteraceae bacterium]|nr:DUF2213 domain-containing protein [Acetobacteraceae bacterium]
MRSSPLLGVEVLPLAYDRMGSVRTFDEDGRLKVKQTNLSKACINPYKGSEIPDWKALGLDPDKIYNLLRCPKALEKGAASFDSLPVLLEHVHVSATHPRHDLVVGATGSNTVFQSPYLENSLSIWDQKAIDKINREEQRELSCAYRYVPKMEAGFYQGKPYDGIMTEIRGNHVALVRKGRAGSDVLVADASPYDADTLFPLLQAFRSFCPHATDMEIRHVVARLIGELTSVPEQEDFLPSVSLWSKKKVPAANNITQDENLNHLPKGTPDGGQFTTKENIANTSTEKDTPDFYEFDPVSLFCKAFDIQKFSDIPDFLDALSNAFPLAKLEFSTGAAATRLTIKEAEQLSKALEKDGFISNLFHKKGGKTASRERVNKYPSKADPKQAAEAAKREREAFEAVKLEIPKSSPALFESYQKEGGHLLNLHMIEPTRYNPTGMTDSALIERAKITSASAFSNMKDLMETYEKALKNPENLKKLKTLLLNERSDAQVQIKIDMGRNIGKYVLRGGTECRSAQSASFLIRKGKNGFYVHTVMLTP